MHPDSRKHMIYFVDRAIGRDAFTKGELKQTFSETGVFESIRNSSYVIRNYDM
jgi:hypothetical protein